MKMTLSGYTHIVAAILLLLYSLYSRSLVGLSIALALILVFYYEYHVFLQTRKYIQNIVVERSTDKKVCSELDEVKMILRIKNKGDKSIPRLILLDMLPEFIGTRKKPIFTIALPPRCEAVAEYLFRVEAPGTHSFEKLYMSITDPLGYFFEQYSKTAKAYIVALPRTAWTKASIKSLQKIIGAYVAGKSASGLYDLAGYRDYQPGDDPRKILWKEYAKTRKLVVRLDYGESRARTLIMVDTRDYLWYVGEPPNTLAHAQLRLARGILEYLARTGSHIDMAVCCDTSPKLRIGVEKDVFGTIYYMSSLIKPGEGCRSPLSAYAEQATYLGIDPMRYDLVILVTNPLTLLLEGPNSLEKLLRVYAGKLFLLFPDYDYGRFVGRDEYRALLSRIATQIAGAGLGLEIPEIGVRIEVGRRWEWRI